MDLYSGNNEWNDMKKRIGQQGTAIVITKVKTKTSVQANIINSANLLQ